MVELEYEDRGAMVLRLGWVKQSDSDIGGAYDCFVRISQQAGA